MRDEYNTLMRLYNMYNNGEVDDVNYEAPVRATEAGHPEIAVSRIFNKVVMMKLLVCSEQRQESQRFEYGFGLTFSAPAQIMTFSSIEGINEGDIDLTMLVLMQKFEDFIEKLEDPMEQADIRHIYDFALANLNERRAPAPQQQPRPRMGM